MYAPTRVLARHVLSVFLASSQSRHAYRIGSEMVR